MSDQWPPQPPSQQGGGYPPGYPPGPYPSAQYPSSPHLSAPRSNAKWYAMLGGLLVVIAGLLATVTGIVGFGQGADALETVDAPPPPPVFEPAGAEGADPFFPLDAQLAGFEQENGQTPTQQQVQTGLYGGTAQNTCDPQRLINFLMANPDKGRAWAHVQGIDYEQIPTYIGGLTVRVLAAPTTVLNHGFDAASGAPYEIATTLDTGTAVLVDAAGDVRARCYCGNPIKPLPTGHKPHRCVQVPHMVFSEPGGDVRREGVPTNVFLPGGVTLDLAWTEIAWGLTDLEIGWTPTNNLHRYLCFVTLPPPPGITPTPTWTPGPTPTWTPEPTPTWTPQPTPTWTPTPTPTPQVWPTPTPTWTPGPTPTWTPTPTPTPFVQPLQISCFITDTDLMVGEQTEFSAFHVPGSIAVSYAFDHGDGTIDRRNPSIAFYESPGSYDVHVIATIEGADRRQFCGTVTVTSGAPTWVLRCSINNTRPLVGETVTLSGGTAPEIASVRYVFDHGDGYMDETDVSYAVYDTPGDYDVRLTAYAQGQESTLFCGTIRVSPDTTPITCSTSGYGGLTKQAAGDLATSRGCAWRVAGEPGDTQYRTDRVNFHLNGHGTVNSVTLG